jgi:hypothetical protein
MEAGSNQCKEQDDEIFCKLSVDGLKLVDSMVKLAGFVKENRMDPEGQNVIGEHKR